MTTPQLYKLYQENPLVETDTRKLKEGALFFALSGPNYNGNSFALQALVLGASYAVVNENVDPGNERIIVVPDVLHALQQLAKYHRQQFNIPFIAITGSNGKTTTKELVFAVLSSHYKTYTTQGNMNNHIGIPLTILKVRPDAEMAVIEMGANHQKEIAGYCEYVLPTHGIITNCGKAHLEGFGGVEGVRKGKGELYDYLRESNGVVCRFNDFDYLVEMSKDIDTVYSYGTNKGDVVGKALGGKTFLQVQMTGNDSLTINTNLVGDYNLPNVLSAVAIGKMFDVPMQKIAHAIASYVPANSRSQMLVRGSNHIILDAYNANPSSLKLAIENMVTLQADHKVLMIGGMMELGDDSLEEHQAIIDLIKNFSWDHVVLVGGDFQQLVHPYIFFQNSDEARQWLHDQHIQDTYILIKGSRSMQMERIINE